MVSADPTEVSGPRAAGVKGGCGVRHGVGHLYKIINMRVTLFATKQGLVEDCGKDAKNAGLFSERW